MKTPTTDISKELDEMFREYFLEVMRGAVEQDGETIAVFAERTKKIRQKFIASTEALIQKAVTEAELQLLESYADAADKEYSWGEVDNWIFAFGDIARSDLMKRKSELSNTRAKRSS